MISDPWSFLISLRHPAAQGRAQQRSSFTVASTQGRPLVQMVHRIQRSVNWFVTRCVRRFGLNPALNPLDAANTGMRRGEVLGLTCRNVDLDTGRLTVSQQILSVEYEARVAEVKTSHIATLDRAHFTVVRPAHCNAFDLVPKL